MTTREGENGVLALTGHRLRMTGEPPEVALSGYGQEFGVAGLNAVAAPKVISR